MSAQACPVSDHARRTARRVADLLANADALLITAGSGMSAECVPADDPELRELQARFEAQGRSFREMAQPYRFDQHADLAWGWYGHRQRWYRRMRPHDGYRIVRSWCQAMYCGSFVATTNIDGQFFEAGFTDWQVLERHGSLLHCQCTQPCCDEVWSAPEPGAAIDPVQLRATGELPRCPRCGALARPNVLMYDDTRWIGAVRREQLRRFDAWMAGVRGKRLVVLEIGAGEGASSVRRIGEKMLEHSRVALVRFNPTASEADEPLHVLRLPALAAIRLIHESLPSSFGGAHAAVARAAPPKVEEPTSPIHLSVGTVTGVDMGRGIVRPLRLNGAGQPEDFAFLQRYGEAQSGWVPVPTCGGLEAPGYTMTARVMTPPEDRSSAPGAAIVFVQAPDERAVATFGVGRRREQALRLWQLLYSTTNRPLPVLECPPEPWIAFRPAAALKNFPEVTSYLAKFAVVLARSYLYYLAFIEATAERGTKPS